MKGSLPPGDTLAGDDLGDGLSALLTGIPRHDYRRHAVQPRSHIHAAAGVQHDDNIGIAAKQRIDEVFLSFGQGEGTIAALMLGHGIESDAGDHRVGPGKRLVESRVVHVVRITEHHPGNGIIVGVLIGELINAPGLEATEDILRTVGLVLPVIDDWFTVDQQPVTVVSTRRKIEVRIGGGFIIERIAIRIVVIDNTRYGRSRVFGIDPHDNGRMYGSARKDLSS